MQNVRIALVVTVHMVAIVQLAGAEVGQSTVVTEEQKVVAETQKASPERHTVHYRPAKATPSLHPIQQRLIERTNAVRAQSGLPPLAVDMSLIQSAQRHTAWMTNSRSLQHSHAQVAENIATGQRSVAEVINSWMNSPGHRANMLNGSYRRLGVAAYRTPEGTIFWCQQFSW